MHNKFRFGFTLAELMAVVIIVALLTILSSGYYKRSVEQARFSEGLMAASAVSEAINRACLERQMNGQSCNAGDGWTIPSINQLDISFPGNSSCNDAYCATKYFQVSRNTSGEASACRVDGGAYTWKAATSGYCIRIFPHFSSSTNKDQIQCVGAGNGIAFCESMGYTNCDNTGECTKPE